MCQLFILKHWLLLIGACPSKYLRIWWSKVHFITYMWCTCTGLRKTMTAGAAMLLLTLHAVLLMPASVSLLAASQLRSCLLACSHCVTDNALRFASCCVSSSPALLRSSSDLGSQDQNVLPVPGRGHRNCNKVYWKVTSVIRICDMNWGAVRWQFLGKMLSWMQRKRVERSIYLHGLTLRNHFKNNLFRETFKYLKLFIWVQGGWCSVCF